MPILKLMKTGFEVGRMQTTTYTMERLLVKVTMEFLWTVTNKATQKQMPDINCDDAPLNNINESDCDNSDSDSDRAKENNTNEIEKEDLIALEENCKLRDLPYDTCLQNELPKEANQVFSIASGEDNKPIHYLQIHYLKSWQTQKISIWGRWFH